MDVRMPDLDGIAATREVLAARPETKVVILTTFEEDDYIFGAIDAGASGFLLKRTSPEELLAGIRNVAAGDSLLSPSVTRIVLHRGVNGQDAREADPDEAPPSRPRAGGHLRLRKRRRPPGPFSGALERHLPGRSWMFSRKSAAVDI
jgi:DNA-binding NarL/FixJ family response regulator